MGIFPFFISQSKYGTLVPDRIKPQNVSYPHFNRIGMLSHSGIACFIGTEHSFSKCYARTSKCIHIFHRNHAKFSIIVFTLFPYTVMRYILPIHRSIICVLLVLGFFFKFYQCKYNWYQYCTISYNYVRMQYYRNEQVMFVLFLRLRISLLIFELSWKKK